MWRKILLAGPRLSAFIGSEIDCNRCGGRSVKIMSNDPAVELELDYISLILPLPYRVALALVLGVWAWGVVIQYFSFIKIDVPLLINPQREVTQPSPPAYASTYRLAFILTAPLLFSLFLFWSLTHRNSSLVIYYDFLPLTYFCILMGILLLPIRPFHSSERSRFLLVLRRISIGGLARTKDGKFGDIILADVLTSYSKIIADMFIVFCMFFSKESSSATAKPNRACGGQYLIPIITAIPYLIRLRQCLTEFWRAQSSGELDSGSRHLANALKYTTGLPVIAFSALQNSFSINSNKQTFGLTKEGAYYCWLTAIFINSSYSFYWDVAKDWDLALFADLFEYLYITDRSRLSNHFHIPRLRKIPYFGLRSSLFLPTPDIYYIAIVLDFFLRFSWLIKLSPSLIQFADSESGITLLEFAEIGRRWIWIFLRSDAEWVRQYEEKEDPALHSILSGRFNEFEGCD
ncbi:Protein ERD1-like protein 2 [Erysiphe neolycopersici]|uniref:Protein ERD1-like protein 2 n=1 Tax=Erysiphe neolycopersici TaxID=212602 RepID=A0A420H6Z9_9PEZI|nr:Protein ERD1-like protein 2 [Erysiphe neolycopersici]